MLLKITSFKEPEAIEILQQVLVMNIQMSLYYPGNQIVPSAVQVLSETNMITRLKLSQYRITILHHLPTNIMKRVLLLILQLSSFQSDQSTSLQLCKQFRTNRVLHHY